MAPDIYSFQSTNHDKKFKIVHDNLEVIGNFYIIVKTTSQSGVIGNQVRYFFTNNLDNTFFFKLYLNIVFVSKKYVTMNKTAI